MKFLIKNSELFAMICHLQYNLNLMHPLLLEAVIRRTNGGLSKTTPCIIAL